MFTQTPTGADGPGPDAPSVTGVNARVEPRANAALAFALLGCVPFLILPGFAALTLAGTAERRIWSSEGRLRGEDRVRLARHLARIGIAFGLITLVALVIVTQRKGFKNVGHVFFQPTFMRESFPLVRTGFWLNIQMFLYGEAFVLVWALVLAVFRTAPGRAAAPLRWFAVAYIDLVRGLPALVTIYLIGFGLPAMKLPLFRGFSDFQFGILALTIVYGAYVAEVYRAGIESVHWSQTAAARSLGFSYGQTTQYVVVPQAIRRIVPPLLNDFIGLQKDTALVNVLGTFEGFNVARNYNSNNGTLTATIVLGLCFVVVTLPMARVTDWLVAREKRRTQAGRS